MTPDEWRGVIQREIELQQSQYATEHDHTEKHVTEGCFLKPATTDNVNHPEHYTFGGIECIDAIQAALTPEEFRGYCKGNAIKYIWREKHKGGDESLSKAGWYMARAKIS